MRQFGLHPWWVQRHYADHEQGLGLGLGSGASGQWVWERDLELALVASPSAGVGECGLDKNVVKDTGQDKGSRQTKATSTSTAAAGKSDTTTGLGGVDVGGLGHGGVSLESQEDILRRHIHIAARLHR